MSKLTDAKRKTLKKSSFALPQHKTASNKTGKGGYPIQDENHARNALARVSQYGSPAEKKQVRKAVYKKYPEMKKAMLRRSRKMM